MNLWRTCVYFIIGGLGYGLIEVLWRGHTHWTMLVLGGICFLAIGAINRALGSGMLCYVLCAGTVTLLEFATGCLVNLRLGWAVWDYSANRFNLLGQICPLYTFFWLLLSIPVCALAGYLDRVTSLFL